MDFKNYPEWNPFLKKVEGDSRLGAQLNIVAGDMKFSPKVLVCKPNEEFRWLGKLLFKGLFDGEHYFELQDIGNGQTKFIHGENFSGFLVGIFKSKLLSKTKDGFEAMNEGLKKRLEV